MKKRLVLLSAFLTPMRSGAEAMVEEVAQRLTDQYDITIITGRYQRKLPKRDTVHGVSVIRVGLGMSFDKWLYPFLAPLAARRLRPDVLHAVLESYAGLALVFCRTLVPRAKRVLTLQSTNTTFLLKTLHRRPHAITAISSPLILRAKRFKRDDVIYIPNGIDLKAINHAKTRVDRDPKRILFVGRLEPMKGIDTLLQAFARLDPQYHLRIVGDGSEREKLKAMAQELQISDRVTFAGFVPVPTIYDEFVQATIFCGLSRSEALGNVFLEAQAAGCAVVASNVGGIPEIVLDQQTGLLVPPDNPRAAAEAIQSLLTQQQQRSALLARAEEHVQKFSWQTVTKRYADVYARVLS